MFPFISFSFCVICITRWTTCIFDDGQWGSLQVFSHHFHTFWWWWRWPDYDRWGIPLILYGLLCSLHLHAFSSWKTMHTLYSLHLFRFCTFALFTLVGLGFCVTLWEVGSLLIGLLIIIHPREDICNNQWWVKVHPARFAGPPHSLLRPRSLCHTGISLPREGSPTGHTTTHLWLPLPAYMFWCVGVEFVLMTVFLFRSLFVLVLSSIGASSHYSPPCRKHYHQSSIRWIQLTWKPHAYPKLIDDWLTDSVDDIVTQWQWWLCYDVSVCVCGDGGGVLWWK